MSSSTVPSGYAHSSPRTAAAASTRRFVSVHTQSFLTVNLNSVSRPDDVKVAGVVTIELSKHINEAIQGDVVCALERCPDKASVICYRLEWTKGREVRLEDYHDCMSLSRLANELSSIGRGPQSELSEQLDLKELQFGTSEKS